MGRSKDNNPWLFTKTLRNMPFNNIVGGILSALMHFLSMIYVFKKRFPFIFNDLMDFCLLLRSLEGMLL